MKKQVNCSTCDWFGYAGNNDICHNILSKEDGKQVDSEYTCNNWNTIFKTKQGDVLILKEDITRDQAIEYFVMHDNIYKIECLSNYYMRKK